MPDHYATGKKLGRGPDGSVLKPQVNEHGEYIDVTGKYYGTCWAHRSGRRMPHFFASRSPFEAVGADANGAESRVYWRTATSKITEPVLPAFVVAHAVC